MFVHSHAFPLVLGCISTHMYNFSELLNSCGYFSLSSGKVIGTFGQDNHWNIEPFIPGVDDDFTNLLVSFAFIGL